MNELLERFGNRDQSLVVEIVVPHARIKQMSDRMFRTADIQIDRHPVFKQFILRKFLVVMRIDVSQEVPG